MHTNVKTRDRNEIFIANINNKCIRYVNGTNPLQKQ